MTTRSYARDATALIVIDLLNDFMAEDGKLSGQMGPMIKKLNLESQLKRLLDGARAQGVSVFYAPHGIDEHSFDDVRHVLPRFQFGIDHHVFWKGSFGADFYPPVRPQTGDVVLSHHRGFDSFFGTDLEDQLTRYGIGKVVLAGFTSQTCVEGTGRHALEAGYHVTFLHDAVGEFTEKAHVAALEVSYPTFGHESLTVDEFLASVEAPA
ncbi:cysteine hydrolase family protein [Streptomyces mirabilis]|uniref:cysteine hydrolase family protein n=1 Tax=Streptomyces mirabilis TaxID=68239 RepID=UPI0033A30B71